MSLGVQRSLAFNTVLDVAYVGNMGRHPGQEMNINQLPYGIRFLPSSNDPTTINRFRTISFAHIMVTPRCRFIPIPGLPATIRFRYRPAGRSGMASGTAWLIPGRRRWITEIVITPPCRLITTGDVGAPDRPVSTGPSNWSRTGSTICRRQAIP